MSWEITAASLREAMNLRTPAPPANRTAPARRDAEPAGILLPVRLEPAPHVVAMVRARTLREHGGEVGFAGGRREPGEALLDTALREAHEELGLPPWQVSPLGELAPVHVITGRYVMHPFVGLAPGDVDLQPAPEEVERVVELPLLPWLTGERPFAAVEFAFEGQALLLPHFPLGDCVLYGASAYVFHELLARLAQLHGRSLPTPELEDELPWRHRYGS
jgi:8-oxo-dGTP pyrophosphatase MutT (NUDIX family)